MKKSLYSIRLFLFVVSLLTILSSTISAQSIDKAQTLFDNGKLNEAKTELESFLKSNKKDAEANFLMGRIYFDEDDFGKAADWFEKAAKYEKGNSKYHKWLGHSYGSRAQNAPTIKQPFLARNSRKNYELSVKLNPNDIDARQSLIEYYLQAPGFLGGGVDKAEKQAEEIEKLDPVQGGLSWGRIYTYTDQPELAHEIYRGLTEQHPAAMQPYNRLFTYYFNEGEFRNAIELVTKQITHNDTTAYIYLNRGNVLQRSERYDEAMDDYVRALSLDSTAYAVHYQIGRLAAVSGTRLEVGEEAIRKFISFSDRYSENTLAWAHFRLGTILEHKDEIQSAKSEYERALRIDKNHEQAKEALAKLK